MKSKINIVLRKDLKFSKVSYYTLRFDDETITELEKFYNKYKRDYSESIDYIKMWIGQIGEFHGATDRFFRNEDNSKALPPNAKEIKHLDLELDQDKMNLRLYCIVLSPEVVILVNGGIKESQETRDSLSCWEQYMFTSNISSQINRMIKLGYCSIKGRMIKRSKQFQLTYNKIP